MLSHRFATLVLPGCLLFASLGSCASAADSVWHTDFETARREAEQSGRPLLVHFYAIWCAPCQMMERQVLHHPEVTTLLEKNVVAVKIEQPRHPELTHRFNVQSLPTDVLIDSSGKELWRNEKFLDRQQYTATIAGTTRRFMLPEQTAPEPPPVQERAGDQEPEGGELFVGVNGYCPVTLVKTRNWIKGNDELAASYKGITYRMADEAAFEEFNRNPAQYAPRLLGCDPVVLNDAQRVVQGDVEYGAFFEGSLYFFRTADNRLRFKQNPLRFTQVRHALNVSEIERTQIR